MDTLPADLIASLYQLLLRIDAASVFRLAACNKALQENLARTRLDWSAVGFVPGPVREGGSEFAEGHALEVGGHGSRWVYRNSAVLSGLLDAARPPLAVRDLSIRFVHSALSCPWSGLVPGYSDAMELFHWRKASRPLDRSAPAFIDARLLAPITHIHLLHDDPAALRELERTHAEAKTVVHGPTPHEFRQSLPALAQLSVNVPPPADGRFSADEMALFEDPIYSLRT